CERSDEIDEERAEQAIQRAQERLANRGSELELERALTSLKRAQVRVNLVRRRRPRNAPPPLGSTA
ncbi:MAG: ATP synthase delta/epsilon chain alpha-helix domain-containing protein, partial [Chloroflexota bacterium]|nr:ATP synthase delta/epsilon chain alpha-helix domain-containing protein [Chloroflexota bacterium]